MRRFLLRVLLVIPMAGIAAACGSNSSSTLPTQPSLPTVLTETFSGTLTHNAAYTHPFSVTSRNSVTRFDGNVRCAAAAILSTIDIIGRTGIVYVGQ